MKKRFLGILAALCLCAALLTTAAFAADWTGWTALEVGTDGTISTTITAGGRYYLDKNLTISGTLAISAGSADDPVTLDLNGHELKYVSTEKGSVIKTGNGAALIVKDSAGGGTITGGTGTVVGSTAYGGGVYMSGGSFTLEGGSITGCTADCGGGVFNDGGTFTMTGGSIANCTATDAEYGGGGVFVNGKTVISGGSITGCTAAFGGGVYQYNGALTMTDGTITGCTAAAVGEDAYGWGGGAFIANGQTFAMSGGSITGCGADVGGGVIVDSSAVFTISGGSITGCTATYENYGAALSNTGTVNADGGTVSGAVYNSYTITRSTGAAGYTAFTGTVNNDGQIKPEACPYTVTFVNGDSTTTVYVLNGQKAAAVTPTGAENYTFGGWYESGSLFDFTQVLTESHTLTAKWLWDINNCYLDDAGLLRIYDGAVKSPAFTLKHVDYTLREGVDYTCGFTPTAEIGSYTLTIAGIGDYTGTITATWSVKRDFSAVCVMGSYTYGSVPPTPFVTNNPGGGEVTFAYSEYSDGFPATVLDEPLTGTTLAVGTYYMVAVIAETDEYRALWCEPVEFRVKQPVIYATTDDAITYSVTADAAEHGTVKLSTERAAAGRTVTVTVTPDTGYTLEALTVTDKNGREIELTDKGGGKYTFKMPAGRVTVTATFMDDNTILSFFTDVTADRYYYDAVLWAAGSGITGGVDDTHFAPDAGCTRVQLAAFLYRCVQSQGGGFTGTWMFRLPFTDVPDWGFEAVAWCYMNGIVKGYGGELFGADDIITREQAATILYRFAQAVGMDVSVGADTNILSYNDVFDVSEYAVEAFQWATGTGVIQGIGGDLMPKATCTRAQIVEMLYRLLGE